MSQYYSPSYRWAWHGCLDAARQGLSTSTTFVQLSVDCRSGRIRLSQRAIVRQRHLWGDRAADSCHTGSRLWHATEVPIPRRRLDAWLLWLWPWHSVFELFWTSFHDSTIWSIKLWIFTGDVRPIHSANLYITQVDYIGGHEIIISTHGSWSQY